MNNLYSDNDSLSSRGKALKDEIPILVWIVPVIALVIGILPLPYGYYPLLRVVVAGCAGFITWKEYTSNNGSSNTYVFVFGAMALLYNPIIPIELFKFTWVIINLATAGIFVKHYLTRIEN